MGVGNWVGIGMGIVGSDLDQNMDSERDSHAKDHLELGLRSVRTDQG